MDACIPNIGRVQRRRRLILGIGALVVAAAVAAVLAAADAHLLIRALVALPLYGAALGFLQYREST
jgi:hypothetical protein